MLAQLFDPVHYAITPYAYPPLFVGALIAFLGLLVLVRERGSPISLVFALMTGCVALWLLAVGISFCARDPLLALRWNKIEHLGVTFIPSLVFLFTLVIVQRWRQLSRWILASLALSALFFASVLFTPWLLAGLHQYRWGPYARYGPLSIPFLLFFFTLLAFSLRCYWVEYAATRRFTKQRRLGALFIAFSVGYVGAIDFLPALGIPIYPCGYLPVFVFVLLAAHTIWRYRLVDLTPAFAAQQIVRTMGEALVVLDQDGVVRVANHAATQLFGRSRDHLVGQTLIPINAHLLPQEALMALLQVGGIRRYEVAHFVPGRGHLTLEITASSLQDRTDQVVGIVYLAKDITERKAAEHEFVRLASFAEQNPNPVIEIDHAGAITYLNPAARETFPHVEAAQPRHPLLEMVASAVMELKGLQKPLVMRELSLGQNVYELHVYMPEPARILVYVSDITSRKALEHQLVQAQKFELIGQLAAGVAHEINSPIQSVSCNTTFLQEHFAHLEQLLGAYERLAAAVKGRGPVSPQMMAEVDRLAEQAELDYVRREIPLALQQSKDSVERVAKIVHSMRELSHPGHVKKTPLDVNLAIEHAVTMTRNEWKYVATVAMDLDPRVPLVPCLENELQQVLLNVIINAAQAIVEVVGDGSEAKGTITAQTRCMNEWVEISISDTGPGMSEPVRAKIFEPFFTTKPVGRGTGQGLAIARSIVVQKLGGTITFQTEEGRGTTFVIRLPVREREYWTVPQGASGHAAS